MADEDILNSFLSELSDIVPSNTSEEQENGKQDEAVIANIISVAAPVVISKKAERRVDLSSEISALKPSFIQSEIAAPSLDSSIYQPTESFGYQPKPSSGLAGGLSSASSTTVTIQRSNKKFVRKAANETWVDESLNEWPENDFRLFIGDLGKETTDQMLIKEFSGYKSFAKAKIVRDPSGRTKGYGFVSLMDPFECAKALREKNGKYLGQRPMKITKSTWRDRDIKEVQKKDKKRQKLQESLGLA